MCTVTFIPRVGGCLLAMNRDDLRTRAAALAPAVRTVEGVAAIYPSEPAGGTWIAASERGLVFTLLNWHVGAFVKRRTRGDVIPALLAAASLEDAARGLRALTLTGMLPFRLVIFSTRQRRIREFRWNGRRLASRAHPWRLAHWFSSGLSDRRAAAARRTVCAAAAQQQDAGSHAWLRRLHRSHQPPGGAISLCVHRPEAATLSSTEVEVMRAAVRMRYTPGNPCQRATATKVTMRSH